jgi:thymidylate synthase (FAD)|tara:strand:+ start:276 stop:941 length:666 start_codon:yes stop_codon:yes gene_type:complete
MEVFLVACTKPSAITGCNGVEEFIAYCARVSNPENQNNKGSTEKLLKYLIKHKHWSPFEMASLTIGIQTTRDISRQILRHRSFSFQEFSQRYAETLNFEIREPRFQDEKNRQNSIKLDKNDPKAVEKAETFQLAQVKVLNEARNAYLEALEKGIAKEQARALLPEGLTGTTLYMSGTLRSWIHFCQLRMAHGTQKEHQDIAKKCWEIIETHFPTVVKACDA